MPYPCTHTNQPLCSSDPHLVVLSTSECGGHSPRGHIQRNGQKYTLRPNKLHQLESLCPRAFRLFTLSLAIACISVSHSVRLYFPMVGEGRLEDAVCSHTTQFGRDADSHLIRHTLSINLSQAYRIRRADILRIPTDYPRASYLIKVSYFRGAI